LVFFTVPLESSTGLFPGFHYPQCGAFEALFGLQKHHALNVFLCLLLFLYSSSPFAHLILSLVFIPFFLIPCSWFPWVLSFSFLFCLGAASQHHG
jgi:hypothetical protein